MIRATLIILAFLSFYSVSFSQESGISEAVSVNIKLYPIHTLTLNPSQDHKVVDLEYKTEEDYLNGVSQHRSNHLSIFSTGAYEVKVRSTSPDFVSNSPGTAGHIQAGSVNIIASDGSNHEGGASYIVQSLSTSEATIVSATRGGVENNYNIEYRGKNGNAYQNHYVSGQNPSVYSATLTYTIVAK